MSAERRRGTLAGGPLQVQQQEPLQDLLVGQVMRPAVGIEHGLIELLVRHVQPGGTLVVEIGERVLRQVGRACAFGVEPGVALLAQFADGLGLAGSVVMWCHSLEAIVYSCR